MDKKTQALIPHSHASIDCRKDSLSITQQIRAPN